MKNKIFSLVLALALMLSGVNAMAATEDSIEVELKPENYAAIYLNKGGNHSSTRKLNAYYNTPYSENAYLYTEYGSIISGYKPPLKSAIDGMAVNYYVAKGSGITSDRYIPIFYDIDRFDLGIKQGKYTGPDTNVEATDGYTAIREYTDNYWVSEYTSKNTYSFKDKKFANQLAAKITTTTTGKVSHDVSLTALDKFVANKNAVYITFATGREVSGFTNAAFGMKVDTRIPTLTLTYSKPSLLEYVKSSTDMATTIAELGEAGILDAEGVSNEGYAAFTALPEARQTEICTTLEETKFDTFDGFITVYDSLINGKFAVYDMKITNATGDTVYSDLASAIGQAVDVKAFTINEAPSGLVSILGAYDANGRLLTAEVANSNIEFSLTIPQGTSTIKLMCWDNIENRAPVCSALSK